MVEHDKQPHQGTQEEVTSMMTLFEALSAAGRAAGGLRASRWAAQGRVATRAVGRGAARPLGPWAIAAHSPNPTQHRGPAGGRPPSRSLVNPPEVLAPGVWGGSGVGGHRDPGSVSAGRGSLDPRPAAGPFVSVNPNYNPNPCLAGSRRRACTSELNEPARHGRATIYSSGRSRLLLQPKLSDDTKPII